MLTVRCIIEMMGAPKEHVEATLKKYVAKWKEEGIKIKKEHYEPMQEKGKLWATFVELEVQFQNLAELMGFCLDALPASIEIVDPESLETNAQDVTALLNDMLGRVHEADMVVKNMRSKMALLDKNTLQTFRNFILHIVKQEAKTVQELSKIVGVMEADLKAFLDKMVEENLLTVAEHKYSVHG